MDWKLELVQVPVSDVDRAKRFYVENVGFHEDHDHRVSDELRFVQLTPPGSACSISLGTGITDAPVGSARCQVVVADVEAAKARIPKATSKMPSLTPAPRRERKMRRQEASLNHVFSTISCILTMEVNFTPPI